MSLRLLSRPISGALALLTFLAPSALSQYVPVISLKTPYSKYASDRILVKFRHGLTAHAKTSLHAAIGARSLRQFRAVRDLESVSVPKGMNVAAMLRSYRQSAQVEYAEPDFRVQALSTPNDPLFPQMWSLHNTGQNGGTTGDDIGATLAWNLGTGNHNIVVATIDSGIDYTHPDLIPNLFHDTSVCNGVNDGSNGCYGISTVYYTSDVADDLGHGTHVSGTIGASGNNTLGVVGINWSVQLLSCKFLAYDGSGLTSDAISCLDYVLQIKNKGYNIVATNNSWGGTEYSQALTDAIQAQQDAGILFIAASGNEFNDNDLLPTYPANTPLPNVISVAATTRTDALAVFSNTGRHSVHIGAPGQEILSTWPGNNYEVLSGTSMAAPHVTGAVALLAAENPSLDWRALKNLLLTGGDSRTSLAQTISGRRLNVNGSMTCSGKTLESRLQPENDVIAATVGIPVALEALNVNCAQPAGNVDVTGSPGGSTITLVDDGTSGDQTSGDGIYSGQWTPSSTGSYTLTFAGGDIVQAEVLNNYIATPSPYNYVTIAGTNLNLADDGIAQIISPFAIHFGGGNFSKVQVGANGTISFTDAYSSLFNTLIPSQAAIPVTLVAPFWQDLYPVQGSAAQNVYWAVLGSAPNRRLVIEWRNVRSFLCHNDSAATVTFEVVFSENSSDFVFEYADTAFGDYCYFQDAGAYATVGVQVSPTVGTMWTFSAPVIVSGSALSWSIGNTTPRNNPVPNITSLSPSSVPINSPSFTLTINGTGFVPTSSVTFNLYEQPTTYVSSTKLTAEIPAESIAQAGTSTYVWVNNPAPGGGQSQLVTFSLSSGVPTITSLSPSSVTAGSFSFTLAVNGTGFGAASIYWNGKLLQGGGPSSNPNQLLVQIPYTLVANPGTVQITVVNGPPGGGPSNPATLTILPQNQSGLFLQPPFLANGGLFLPNTPLTPMRFLGWNYGLRAGQDYRNAFSRPRAQSSLPAALSSKSTAAGTGALTVSSSAPPLAGLQLRPLLPADYIPTAVAAADVNGDGIPDWVVSNGGSNNLWVYLGRGDGTFTQATVIPLKGQAPVAVALADLRGIGRLDIIVAEADSVSVGVLLGNGNGTFDVENTFFLPGAPISLAVADMNHDGRLDIVAGVIPDPSITTSGAMVTLIGDGTGSFAVPLFEASINFGVQVPESIVVADFEKNGKPDVIAVDPGVGAVVYVNDGNGLLKEAQPIDISFRVYPLSLASGDVNQDGCPDLVDLNSLGIAQVILGNCDGTFQPISNYVGEGDFGYAVTLVDVNGDGHLDLVYSGIYEPTGGYGQTAGNLIGVNFGDGKGNFGPAHVFRGGQTSFGLAVADFNRDGHPDILTANQDSDSASMFLNDGKGGFGFPTGGYGGYINGPTPSGPVNAPTSNFASADIDGDGRPDLLVIDVGSGYPNALQAAVMLNDGTGHFGSAIHSTAGEGTFEITDFVLGDFRNSGRPDLVTIASYFGEGLNPQLVFAPNTGSGSFGAPKTSNIPLSGTLASGDFNHDGFLDVAIATGASQTGSATITIYLGHGDGTFTAQPPINFNTSSNGHWVQGLWVGDFNGDGKLDLLAWFYLNVVPFQKNDVYEFLGKGDGTFAPAKLVIQNLTNPAVADLNHDGRPDVMENRDPQALYPAPGGGTQFQVFICQPDGTFALSKTYAPYSGQSSGRVTLGTANGSRAAAWIGDFNGDGNIDLAAIQQAIGYPNAVTYVQFMIGNGDGTFTPTYEPYYLYGSHPSNAFDLTGDGRTDMVENDGFTSSFHVIPAGNGSPVQLALLADPVIGTKGTVQVSLAQISNSSTQVALAASDPAISIQASIAIAAGSLTQNVAFVIGNTFNSSHVFWIQGSLNGSTATAYGTQATSQGQYGTALSTEWSTEATFPGLPTSDYQLVVSSLAGYSTTVTFSCKGLPAGASCQAGSIALNIPAGGSNSTSLIVHTSANTPFGVYPITIQASDGAVTSQARVILDVGDFNVNLTPASKTVLANSTATYTANISTTNNYGGNFAGTCTGIPAPAVCSVNGRNVSIQTNTLAAGNYSFTVSLSNGVASRSASAQLSIGDFSAILSATSLSVGVGQSGTVAITVTGQNGFGDAVSLSCSGAPIGTNCILNPSTVTPSAGGSQSTLTVQVITKPPQSHSRESAQPRTAALYLSSVGLFGVILLFSRVSSSSDRALMSLTLLLVLGITTSWGGGGGSGTAGAGGGGGGGSGSGGGGGGSSSFSLTVQSSADAVTRNVGTIQVTVP